MASTVEEPDLFNDVEILEIGDFNTDGDENYVSVELRSDNDDDDDDGILLDPEQFSSPKALDSDRIETTHSNTPVMTSGHSHRFLSDHAYLVGDGMDNLVPREVSRDQIAIKVQNSRERFSVPYDEDLGMQDLFNEDNAQGGAGPAYVSQEQNADNETQVTYEELLTSKIEIGETEFQEQIMDNLVVGDEITSHQSEEFDSQDECSSILLSLDNSLARLNGKKQTLTSLENDHSYTTINLDTPQPSGDEESSNYESDEPDLKKLVSLSNKLASRGDVSSIGALKTAGRIEKMVKSLQRKPNEQTARGRKCFSDAVSQTISVEHSPNCSERLEGNSAAPSSGESTVTSNGLRHEDSSSEMECQTRGQTSDGRDIDLDELITLGNKFTVHCERLLEKGNPSGGSRVRGTEKFKQLSTIFRKLKRQCRQISKKKSTMDGVENVSRPREVETAAQKHLNADQRVLNEECKKRLLESESDSSSFSESEGSVVANSSDSDRDGDDMMNDFVRRNRHKKKGADSNRKAVSRTDSVVGKEKGPRGNQIYSDSSSDDENHLDRDRDRGEGEDNLLDGVLSGVDDIMSDVHDIIPDAMGVVQEYLAGEEKRQEREERSEKMSKRANEHKNADKASNKSTVAKNVKDMTESEREEYYEEMQIERLCNISNLVVCRNASASSPVPPGDAAKAKPNRDSKRRKTKSNIDDFLNEDSEGSDFEVPPDPPSEDSSEDEFAVAETEEQFLQKCNENMKQQLLNQASSSEDESNSDDTLDDDKTSSSAGGKQNGMDEDDSVGSADALVDNFLKRSKTKTPQKKGKEKSLSGEQLNGEPAVIANGQTSSPDKSDDSVTGENTRDKAATEKQKESSGKQSKLQLANPKDKELFSENLLDSDDDVQGVPEKLSRRKRKRHGRRRPTTSDSGSVSSADSDIELLEGSTRKRKQNPTIESFDFSATLSSLAAKRRNLTTATEKTTAAGGGSLSEAKKPSPPVDADVAVASSPAGVETTPASNASTKQKSSKDGQDCISVSSDSSDETELITGDLDEGKTSPEKEPKRKIRAMLTNDELAEETKKAQKEEEGRVARLKKKTDQLKKFLVKYRPTASESELVLDYDSTRQQAICVHPDIVKLLKPHQMEGIKFMYDNTYGSVDALPKHQGSGCILAHCMGLGKTLQMISLLHTVMRYPQLLTNRVLVICPKSTVMNWKEEISRWQGTINTGYQMKVYHFQDVCSQNEKISVLKRWFSCKSPYCGVMLIGYEAFRALINYERRKGSLNVRSSKLELIKEYLLNPGADLVICDEGHQIKNKRSAISEAVSKIKTRRRIMLTGTPIQNNLKEYYCMVNFIKPSFLGSDKEFSNLYANPIKNGQCKDSDQQAIKIMKQRSYVLHNKLSKFVQRKEAAVLKDFLPEKFEYVLFVPLTPVQEKMYEVFLQMNEYTSSSDAPLEAGRTKKFKLIADYTSLRKIWTHPKVLEMAWESAIQEKSRKDAARKTSTPDSYDESPDDHNDIASGQLSVTNDWWRRYLQTEDLESLYPSNKLWILFEILKQCNERGEKCLIFSAFVAVLNVVEHFMAKIHNQDQNPQNSDAFAYSAFKGPWEYGKHYYRLDGKTHKSIRHKMITSFNDPQNTCTKCFLISAKAGGQGINLIGANRVIILDTSWNPSNDQQNIFRIFRLGQKRKCYVYRLIAAGTMEEKVYSRSVTKQALSFRVVDEQQIDRHYSYGELAELYTLTKLAEMTRETPILPADDVLASLLRTFPNKIFKYHEHDSLLENKPEQDLSEEEKKEAWAAYEREIQNNENRSYLSQFPSFGAASAAAAAGALFGTTGYGASMASYYSSLGGYPGMGGLPMGAGDMYRNDFSSYGASMGRSLYMPYGAQQQYAQLLSDPSLASALAKAYGGYSVPGSSGMDFGLSSLGNHSSSMGNGQSMMPTAGGSSGSQGPANKPYNSTAALANMLNYYAGQSTPGPGGLPPSLGGPTPPVLPSSSSSSLADLAAQHSASNSSLGHYNPLKQMSDYTQGNPLLLPNPMPSATGLAISSIASLHKQNQPAGKPSGSSSLSTGISSLFSRLSEQLGAPPALSSAGTSSPFAPRNVPLLSPTIDTQARSSAGISSGAPSLTTTTSSGTSVPMTASTTMSNTVPVVTTASVASIPAEELPSARPTFTSPKPAETSTTTASLRPATMAASARDTTIIPIDDEDSLQASDKRTPQVSNVGSSKTSDTIRTEAAKNSGVGGMVHKKQESIASKISSAISAGFKDLLKTSKSLTNLGQQPLKSIAPKVPISGGNTQNSPTAPPIISNPGTGTVPMARSNSVTALSTPSPSGQQVSPKVGPMNAPQGTKITSNVKSQNTANKPSPLARRTSTVQTPPPTNKGLSQSPVTTMGKTSSSMRFVYDGKGATAPAVVPPPKPGASVVPTIVPVSRSQGPSLGNVTKTTVKPTVITSNIQQVKRSSPATVSKSVIEQSPGSSTALTGNPRPSTAKPNVTIPKANVAIPKPNVAIPKSNVAIPKPIAVSPKLNVESRPVTITPLSAESAVSKVTKNPTTPTSTGSKPGPTVGMRSSVVTAPRPITTQPKSHPMTLIPPGIIQSGIVSNKLTDPLTTNNREISGAQGTIVKSSTSPASVTHFMSTSKPTGSTPNTNRVISTMSRMGKGVVSATGPTSSTITPSVGIRDLTITKGNPVTLVSTFPQARVGSGTVAPNMTIIPMSNISATKSGTGPTSSNVTRTVSYSYKDSTHKDIVIRKAVAAPTMRRILPAPQGTQQLVMNRLPTPANNRPGTPSTITPGRVLPGKPNIPVGGIIRLGPGNSSVPQANIQSTSINSMFIRKRGVDAATLDIMKGRSSSGPTKDGGSSTASESGPPARRPRLEDMNTTGTTTSVGAPVVMINRPGGGISSQSVPTKNNKKDDSYDVVVVE